MSEWPLPPPPVESTVAANTQYSYSPWPVRCGQMFEVELVSSMFEGKALLARHRMVRALKNVTDRKGRRNNVITHKSLAQWSVFT